MLEVERLRSAIEKNASFWKSFKSAFKGTSAGKALGGAMVAAGGAAATAAIGHGVSMGVETLRDRLGKGKAYKGMLSASPGLAKRKDADKVQMTFNTLWNLNRDLAKDPLTAGSFVERSVQRADVGDSSGSYVDIETARNLLRSAPRRERPIAQAFAQGGAGALPGEDWGSRGKLERYKAQLKDDPATARDPFGGGRRRRR